MDPELKKVPENMFKAIANTLEVLMSYWNHINEMYSNIRQGEQETTNQLDQCIKVIVKNCGYTSGEEKKKTLTGASKHFKVKKLVRLQTAQNKTVMFDKMLLHAKQHKATVKDFNQHKSN